MDPITILAAANAALALVEALIPQIASLAKKGDISIEQQKTVLENYEAVKAACKTGFVGSEWDLSTARRLA